MPAIQPIEVFFSYAHEDEELRDELAKHLRLLERQGEITAWYNRKITPGTEWANQIDQHLETARMILLLVSADFLASDYCYDVELKQAMERHEAGLADVIPVILRPVYNWRSAPFGQLQPLPENGIPVTNWENRDQAFANIVQGIRKAAEKFAMKQVSEEPGRSLFGFPSIARTGANPFEYGPPVSPERFYGRLQARISVKYRIGAMTAQSINIVGLRRSGKTSLLRYIRERTEEFFQPEQTPLIVSLDLQNASYHTPAGIIEGLRRGVRRLTGIEPWSKESNNDSFEILDGLEALRHRGYRLIVMFDEFEAIGRRLELFQDWGEDWRAKNCAGLLTTVIASKRPLREIYTMLQLTSPFDNIFSITILGAMEDDAWHDLVQDGFDYKGAVGVQDLAPLRGWIDDLAGGLPFYVQMAAAMLWQHNDLETARRKFVLQATPRFQELWADLTNPEHYALRHAAGIADLAEPDRAIIETLQRHGLLRPDGRLFSSAFVEFIRGQQ